MTEKQFSPREVAETLRKMSPEQLATTLGHLANNVLFGYEGGYEAGVAMQREHRTIQGQLVNFFLGCLSGLGAQAQTDARNAQAIEACQIISAKLDSGEIPFQPFI